MRRDARAAPCSISPHTNRNLPPQDRMVSNFKFLAFMKAKNLGVGRHLQTSERFRKEGPTLVHSVFAGERLRRMESKINLTHVVPVNYKLTVTLVNQVMSLLLPSDHNSTCSGGGGRGVLGNTDCNLMTFSWRTAGPWLNPGVDVHFTTIVPHLRVNACVIIHRANSPRHAPSRFLEPPMLTHPIRSLFSVCYFYCAVLE